VVKRSETTGFFPKPDRTLRQEREKPPKVQSKWIGYMPTPLLALLPERHSDL
jgi:hypothetical protein